MTEHPSVDDRSAAATDSDADLSALSSSALVAQALAASPVATIVVAADETVAYVNDHAAEALDREDVIGRPYHEVDWTVEYADGTPIPTEDQPITRVLETGDPVSGFEHWAADDDGQRRWVTTSAAPIRDDDEVAYVVATFEDVTPLKRREERLTSDHVRRLEFRADREAVPPSLRVADCEEIWLDVESVVMLESGRCVQYMGTDDLPPREFLAAVEEVPHYVDARLLATTGEYSRVEAHADQATVMSVFPALDGRARAVVIRPDEVRFLGEVPGDVDHRLVADGIREFHPEAELVEEELVYSPQLLFDVVADALTDRQFAVLEAAYYGGYFDSPRTSTGDDLADRFDVTRQTLNQHLRKAERVVFQHLFEKSGAGTT